MLEKIIINLISRFGNNLKVDHFVQAGFPPEEIPSVLINFVREDNENAQSIELLKSLLLFAIELQNVEFVTQVLKRIDSHTINELFPEKVDGAVNNSCLDKMIEEWKPEELANIRLIFKYISGYECNQAILTNTLEKAAKAGQIGLMKDLLSEGAQLCFALRALANEAECVGIEYLLCLVKDTHPYALKTLLNHVLEKEQDIVIPTLLKCGLDADPSLLRQAIETAYGKLNWKCVRSLLKSVSITKDNSFLGQVLFYAAKDGSWETVTQLIAMKAPLDTAVDERHYPIHFAISTGVIEQVQAFMDAGFDATLHPPRGLTALEFAEEKGRTSIIQILKSKESIKSKIMHLMDRRRIQQALEEAGKYYNNISLMSEQGNVKRELFKELFLELIKRELIVEYCGIWLCHGGKECFQDIRENFLDILAKLVQKRSSRALNALVDYLDDENLKTINQEYIHAIIEQYIIEMYDIEKLLPFANLAYQNSEGDSFLHIALSMKSLEHVKVLLAHKAPISLINKANESIITTACKSFYGTKSLHKLLNMLGLDDEAISIMKFKCGERFDGGLDDRIELSATLILSSLEYRYPVEKSEFDRINNELWETIRETYANEKIFNRDKEDFSCFSLLTAWKAACDINALPRHISAKNLDKESIKQFVINRKKSFVQDIVLAFKELPKPKFAWRPIITSARLLQILHCEHPDITIIHRVLPMTLAIAEDFICPSIRNLANLHFKKLSSEQRREISVMSLENNIAGSEFIRNLVADYQRQFYDNRKVVDFALTDYMKLEEKCMNQVFSKQFKDIARLTREIELLSSNPTYEKELKALRMLVETAYELQADETLDMKVNAIKESYLAYKNLVRTNHQALMRHSIFSSNDSNKTVSTPEVEPGLDMQMISFTEKRS